MKLHFCLHYIFLIKNFFLLMNFNSYIAHIFFEFFS